MDKNIKKAFELAEQEVQEKEIANLKRVVKDLLEKKAKAEEEKREIEKEISVIKQTIDDFKAGRLDKVKELIEKDGVAKDILPFKIIIINQTIINQPWKWIYQILPSYTPSYYGTSITANGSNGMTYTTCGTQNLLGGAATAYTVTSASADCSNDLGWSGSNFATFTGGTYDINGKIINL
jgi:hypothetical protein